MELPLIWILGVARRVAALDGAVTRVVAPPAAVLPLIALGGLFWCSGRGGGCCAPAGWCRWRWPSCCGARPSGRRC